MPRNFDLPVDDDGRYRDEQYAGTEEEEKEPDQESEDQLEIDLGGWLFDVYSNIGIDEPSNHSQIVSFMKEDVLRRSGVDYSETDFPFAFQNFIEKTPVKKYRAD